MSREILYNVCLFPMELVELINSYSPEPVSKCVATVCKYGRNKVLVGKKRVCVIDYSCAYCVVYSGKTFKPVNFFQIDHGAIPVAMAENDDLITVWRDFIIIYKTNGADIDEKVQNEFDKLDKSYNELKVSTFSPDVDYDDYYDPIPMLKELEETTWENVREKVATNLNIDDLTDRTCIDKIYTWNSHNIYCDLTHDHIVKYHKNTILTIMENKTSDLYIVSMRNGKVIRFNNEKKEEIQDILYPTRWSNICIVLFVGYLKIYNREFYEESNTRVYVPKPYNKIRESPDGRKILVYGEYGHRTRQSDTDYIGILIDIETGITTDGFDLGLSSCFIDSQTVFVKDRRWSYLKVSRDKVEEIKIQCSGPICQIATGDIFIAGSPILDNKNCEITGTICGMLENGTIVSDTGNELKFYTS